MIDSGRFNLGQDNIDTTLDDQFSPFADNEQIDVTESEQKTTNLFDLGQIDVRFDDELATLWAFMTPSQRPNSNMGLIRDTMAWQEESRRLFASKPDTLKYMVLGSRFPGIFNLGGDLEMFADCIQRRDRATLLKYGVACCEIIDKIWHCNGMDIINVGLAQGDALGGGLEALMCFDVIIAEKQARFGLPEILFGLFPGMGAYSILSRRVGPKIAKDMIIGGRVYTADEMHDMGIVTKVVETGTGEAATAAWIKENTPRHAGYVGIHKAGRRVNPMTLQELTDIVEMWTDTALALTDRDLRMMRRLASAQTRLR